MLIARGGATAVEYGVIGGVIAAFLFAGIGTFVELAEHVFALVMDEFEAATGIAAPGEEPPAE